MKDKYKEYIEYIAKDIEKPYIKYLNMYGLKHNEMKLVLSKVFNQPVLVRNNHVYNTNNNEIYRETNNGDWVKYVYDTNGSLIYYEYSDGVIMDRR